MANARQQLRQWREGLKLTLEQAAERFPSSKKEMLGAVERGERLPGRTLANEIKAVTGIPTEAWDELAADNEDVSARKRGNEIAS